MLPAKFYFGLKRWDFKRSHKADFESAQNKRLLTTAEGYSFAQFDRTKSIFVHIPKCAGTSVSKALFGNLAGGHATLNQYTRIFEQKYIFEYFKFTIVRNPWDRLVSAYFFLRSGGFGESDRNWAENEIMDFSSFDDFVKHWVNRKNIWKWYHFRPQYHYMLEKFGKANLDFVAFLENIDEDFSYIAKRIGVNCVLNVSNSSKHTSYVDYYNEESASIVAEVYAEDIKMLGYNFDNSNLAKQIKHRSKGEIYSL